MEGLLQDLGGVLRLVAITCEALLRCETAMLSGFRVSFDGIGWWETWCTPGARVGLWRWQSAQAHVTHASAHL